LVVIILVQNVKVIHHHHHIARSVNQIFPELLNLTAALVMMAIMMPV
jgi:hypothetical protein